LVAERAPALASGSAPRSARAERGVDRAGETLIPNNVSPALITAALLRDLSAELS
jgi:hypothetical protein